MIRKLKILMLTTMAVAAVGALNAAAAQAVPEFHCEVEPCTYTLTPDETSSTVTAHHVFRVDDLITGESIGFTCNQITGNGTTDKKQVRK